MQLFSFILFTFYFLSIVNDSAQYGTKAPQYKVSLSPPTIKAYQPKGLSVSIPHSPGITLFAFHGNINHELGLHEGGTLSRDIVKPQNGTWTYKDDSVKLNVGDIISYWVYVVKDGLGYGEEIHQFVVKGEEDANIWTFITMHHN